MKFKVTFDYNGECIRNDVNMTAALIHGALQSVRRLCCVGVGPPQRARAGSIISLTDKTKRGPLGFPSSWRSVSVDLFVDTDVNTEMLCLKLCTC